MGFYESDLFHMDRQQCSAIYQDAYLLPCIDWGECVSAAYAVCRAPSVQQLFCSSYYTVVRFILRYVFYSG